MFHDHLIQHKNDIVLEPPTLCVGGDIDEIVQILSKVTNVCIKYTVSNWRILNHGFWNVCQVHLINWKNKLCQNFKFIQKNRKILSSNLIEGLKLTDGISILSKNDSAGHAGGSPQRPGRSTLKKILTDLYNVITPEVWIS